jgi:soluble cytochrome b562
MRSDQIRPGKIRLNSETANNLAALARTVKKTQISEVLKGLVARYIVPARKNSSKVDSQEMERLIRQLDNIDHRWSKDGDVEAVKRLGDLGDPRAIPVLTKASKNMLIDLQIAAEESIKKIKNANR